VGLTDESMNNHHFERKCRDRQQSARAEKVRVLIVGAGFWRTAVCSATTPVAVSSGD
jgi:hypothetical protein